MGGDLFFLGDGDGAGMSRTEKLARSMLFMKGKAQEARNTPFCPSQENFIPSFSGVSEIALGLLFASRGKAGGLDKGGARSAAQTAFDSYKNKEAIHAPFCPSQENFF